MLVWFGTGCLGNLNLHRMQVEDRAWLGLAKSSESEMTVEAFTYIYIYTQRLMECVWSAHPNK